MNYHRLGGLNNKHLFPIDLESGKSKISASADLASGSEMVFSLCLHLVKSARELSGIFFFRKGTNLIHKGSTFTTKSPLQRLCPLIPSY